jgi:hypothetical protein
MYLIYHVYLVGILKRYSKLNDLHSSPNIIRVTKARIMRRVVHVVLWGREEVYTGFWWGNLRERDHLEDPGVDGSIILRWIFRKWDGGMNWIDLAQDKYRWRTFVNVVMNLRIS